MVQEIFAKEHNVFNKIRLGVNGIGTLLWVVFLVGLNNLSVSAPIYVLVVLAPALGLWADFDKRDGSKRAEVTSTFLWMLFWGCVAFIYAVTHISMGGWVGGASASAWFGYPAEFLLYISILFLMFSVGRSLGLYFKQKSTTDRSM